VYKGAVILALVLAWNCGAAHAATTRITQGTHTEAINGLLNAAGPGDTLLFEAGTYRGPFRLDGVHGEPDLPVVIIGEGPERTIIDGQTEPASGAEHYAFRLENCSWISIGQFTIRNCWTDLVLAVNSSYVSLDHCRLEGGKRALFAKGRDSHHFLVEHCAWEQDKRVWTHEGDWSWEEIHHGIHRHYNGSIFQGSLISGVFVIRDNVIRNTFNAFRLSPVEVAEGDPLACSNGEIYGNTIFNTSDNVLEPEVHALNLHYYHNRMVNGHAFISITEVGGGPIYVYGNTAVSLPESEDGWTIFKISSNRNALVAPLYVFNNSWQVDFDMVGSPRDLWKDDHVIHFNNACFSEASDTFGIYNLGKDNRFDYDCSNVPFPVLLTGQGHEKHGIVADPEFRAPYENDFHLEEGSPCTDRGMNDPTVILTYRGKAPDIGAYDNGRLIEGMPFRYMDPQAEVPFRERPRIVRHRWEGMEFSLWFSVPLTRASVDGLKAVMQNGPHAYPLGPANLSEDGTCLTFATRPMERPRTRTEAGRVEKTGGERKSGDQKKAGGDRKGDRVDAGPPSADGDPADLVLSLSHRPIGKNGMPMTVWAGTIPVSFEDAVEPIKN